MSVFSLWQEIGIKFYMGHVGNNRGREYNGKIYHSMSQLQKMSLRGKYFLMDKSAKLFLLTAFCNNGNHARHMEIPEFQKGKRYPGSNFRGKNVRVI